MQKLQFYCAEPSINPSNEKRSRYEENIIHPITPMERELLSVQANAPTNMQSILLNSGVSNAGCPLYDPFVHSENMHVPAPVCMPNKGNGGKRGKGNEST
jgi:hypothetical protein